MNIKKEVKFFLKKLLVLPPQKKKNQEGESIQCRIDKKHD